MKKILLTAIVAIFSLSPATFVSSAQIAYTTTTNPQVCQFSLSSYNGTADDYGKTNSFTVGLSCPQESDVYATVVAFVNDEIVASEVVKIPAGKTKSAAVTIKLGSVNAKKYYKLGVQ